MRVPRYAYASQFLDLPALSAHLCDVLAAGEYILSEHVQRFEDRFAAYLGARCAVGVNSGTDALILALTALGIGRGDEVITVANTFHATVLAVLSVGATPVLVDCEPGSWLMDLDATAAACGPRTRAILAVHLFGRTLDMDRLVALADRHGVALVEDCAQAVGATWRGRKVGTFGAAGCFSFHPSKNLAAAGDAGAVVTSDLTLDRELRILRNLGQDGQNNHVHLGMNSKLDAVQAVVLDAKLNALDEWNAARRTIADLYRQALAPTGISVAPAPSPPGDHVYHLLQVTTLHRDQVLNRLRADGVDAVVRYPVPVHRQPAFAARANGRGEFPHTEFQAVHTLCLPMRPDLTDSDVGFVCTTMTSAVAASTSGIPL
ncbi:DegT/DnrJ/EryC1/StrS family aminotransferase [Nocardia sp. NPDC006630]|uniref:DegT/DnrJ/EryC1/StrS family aminotransferase n=1 Tax=Nocardia sp. NPDC006630 TaxID=3157181 RepID=UPI0033A69418